MTINPPHRGFAFVSSKAMLASQEKQIDFRCQLPSSKGSWHRK